LKRERSVAFNQIPGVPAVDAGAAGVALGEVDYVAVSRGISDDDGRSEAWFELARLDCHGPAGFIDGCDDRYGGREDAVWAAGRRILGSRGAWDAEERGQR